MDFKDLVDVIEPKVGDDEAVFTEDEAKACMLYMLNNGFESETCGTTEFGGDHYALVHSTDIPLPIIEIENNQVKVVGRCLGAIITTHNLGNITVDLYFDFMELEHAWQEIQEAEAEEDDTPVGLTGSEINDL